MNIKILLFTAVLIPIFTWAAPPVLPTLVCNAENGAGFTAKLQRGAHYDHICDVWVKDKSGTLVRYTENECPGSLYSSEPAFVLGIDLGSLGSVRVERNGDGEQTYYDANGSSPAKCEIENDFRSK
ncbi:MAG: hypothetical protein AB7G93_13480 [Bdellovibrionales bacterium]